MSEQMVAADECRECAEKAARGYYREGLNCAECVLKSFLDLRLTDFPPETVALASGFGGGIGMTKNVCGALSGAVLAIASRKGRKNPLAKETVAERTAELNAEGGIYSIFAAAVRDFEERYGTVVCRELTAPYEDWHSKERRKKCQEMIGFAAGLAVTHALKENS